MGGEGPTVIFLDTVLLSSMNFDGARRTGEGRRRDRITRPQAYEARPGDHATPPGRDRAGVRAEDGRTAERS